MKLDHLLTPYAKTKLERLRTFKCKPETIKILKESIGSNFSDTGHSNIFVDGSPEAKETKANINYWDYIKIKASAQQRKQPTKPKDNLLNGRRYFQMITL